MYTKNKKWFMSLVMSAVLLLSGIFNTISYADVPLLYSERSISTCAAYTNNGKQYINTDFTDGALVELETNCNGCCIQDEYIPTPHKKVRIDIDGTATQEQADELQAMLKLVPYTIVNAFVDDGFRILLSSNDLRDYVGYKWDFEPSGVYSYNTKTIYLSNKRNNDWAVNSLYHEFGHYVDVRYGIGQGYVGYMSKKEPFISIYNSEKANFKVDSNKNLAHYQSSPAEMFAQAFAEYLVNPDRLKNNTPKTYNYVKKVVESIR